MNKTNLFDVIDNIETHRVPSGWDKHHPDNDVMLKVACEGYGLKSSEFCQETKNVYLWEMTGGCTVKCTCQMPMKIVEVLTKPKLHPEYKEKGTVYCESPFKTKEK